MECYNKKNRTAYAITITGLIGLTSTSAVELASYNILVNAVSPGFTLTELTEKSLNEEEIQQLYEVIPIDRLARPSEIAQAVMFLASDLNTYLAGQNIVVDGGFSNV